ncbi:helix-turn-helix transcriptional regulator [Blastococcus brunescens]|uniref:Helix-turn-helix transcriptional regulator n=1 Tax=Blastococcus brunescens TaxID=1564165 RepID=A0ABZ1AY68_9ACTN|nr:helix-turn-helix transcriptional regulator [Blastococcus sp. BMG 8361]WRL62431.1 helix-turn-helix transcriptional regulator [Blastococcus sp. BMG 8361]
MTQPPSPPRRPRSVAGTTAGARRARSGGRVAGTAYAPPSPADAGAGARFPYRDYSGVEPRSLRESYEWWQDIARDVADRRRARRWEQNDVADAARVSVNTVQRIERGQWTAVHNLFAVCSVLGLRVEQIVDVTDPRSPAPADRAARRALSRPAASDRVATREEVMAGRRIVAELAAHHQLLEPRIDLDGTVYVRAGRPGYGPLWRFAAVVSQTLGVWVNVSGDEAAAIRNEADLL